MNHQQALADFSFAFKPPSEGGVDQQQQQQHTAVTPPGLSALSNTSSDETTTTTTTQNNNSNMVPLELESRPSPPTNMNDKMMMQQQQQQQQQNNRPGKKIAKAFGKKIGGAFSKINVAKWIDQLEQDQELADHLDRINSDTADEQERQFIKQQAHDACLQAMKDHLLEFITEQPQATYEEWICSLHPDNINTNLDGLTNIPLIDHRFYVIDSDHRILWNEHLNDLSQNSTNDMTPVRHYVAARSFMTNTNQQEQQSTTEVAGGTNEGNNTDNNSNLISWDVQPEQQSGQYDFNNNNQQATTTTAAVVTTGVDLLSL